MGIWWPAILWLPATLEEDHQLPWVSPGVYDHHTRTSLWLIPSSFYANFAKRLPDGALRIP